MTASHPLNFVVQRVGWGIVTSAPGTRQVRLAAFVSLVLHVLTRSPCGDEPDTIEEAALLGRDGVTETVEFAEGGIDVIEYLSVLTL